MQENLQEMKQARLADYFEQNQDNKYSSTSSSRITPTLFDLRNPTSNTLQINNNPQKSMFLNKGKVETRLTKEKNKKRKRIYGDGILSEFTKKLKLTPDQFSSLKSKSSIKLLTEKDHQPIKYVKPILPKKPEAVLSIGENEDSCAFVNHKKSFTDFKGCNSQEGIIQFQDTTRGDDQAEASQNFLMQEETPMTSSWRNHKEILGERDEFQEIRRETEENQFENKISKIVGKSNRGCQEVLLNDKLVFSKMSNDPAEEILLEPSIREKYEELLKTERDFVLPLSYKKLVEILKSLDMMINYFIMHQKSLCFSDLAQSLLKSLKIKITEGHLTQINYAAGPCLYQVFWMKNEKNKGKWDLCIKFPDDENKKSSVLCTKKLEERQVILKEGLLKITKKHHSEFLKSINAEKCEDFYERQKCWHSRFRVHDCPLIPEGKLPDRPDQKSIQTIEEFLRESEVKNQRVKQAMEEVVKKAEKDQAKKLLPPKNRNGISEKLLLKVKAKEFAFANQVKEKENGILRIMKEDLKRVAETLKVYFTLRSVSSMYLVQIMQHLSERQEKCIIGKDEAERYIRELIRLCPEWLSIKVLSNLNIITMNKSISMSCIYDSIEKRLQ